MPLTALAIALGAAVIHARWNLVIARSTDNQAVTAVAIFAGTLVAMPLALIRWNVQPEAWPWIIASSVLELVYFYLLTTAYRRAEMSLIYPIARGMAPVIVLIVSIVFGVAFHPWQIAGVALVGGGVMLVRGIGGGARWSDVLLALSVATAIAGYTLIDKQGVRYADPITYLFLILVAPAVGGVLFVAARGGWGRIQKAIGWQPVAAGIGTTVSYGLVLVALGLAPAATVAAVREVGVVFAVFLGAVFLREAVGPTRWIGALVVALGVALVVLG
ncbi:MAG TPA: DMT family transporter [Candidatus Limnocylindria bacterium]|nr:DMT family transporter [Candidatus Limnocylindria bacterium]